MADSPLFWSVYDRLVEASAPPALANLVEAAFQGDAAVLSALTGSDGATRAARPLVRPRPRPCYLTRVEVTSFRGVGPKATLDLAPGPGLTLVTGRNGTGKSSFAEGLEVLLTGSARRLDGKAKDWKEGWRCLHAVDAPQVRATFTVEEQAPTTIVRRWAAGAELADSTVEGLAPLGWSDAIQTHRPFLAYAELGNLLEAGPTRAYDSLKPILGLEELSAAVQRLSDARLAREKAMKEAKAALQPILARLGASADPRAAVCTTALGKKWNLDAIEPTLTGEADNPVPEALRRLVNVRAPTLDPEPLRRAVGDLAAIAAGDSARQLSAAELLLRALRWHDASRDAACLCPVCHIGTLDAAWHKAATAEAAELEKGARAAQDATALLKRAHEALRPPAPPLDLNHPLAADALAAWTALHRAPEDALALVAHVEAHAPTVASAVQTMVAEAQRQIAVLEDAWRPLRLELLLWLGKAKAAMAMAVQLERIAAAETWLKDAETELQTERFAPIAERAAATWLALRQQSSVGLRGISLQGGGTRRRLDLALEVDGAEAPLGVMSQGEVNALALSLFIPRLVHDDSPFHFVIIDDPVQSMDPFKVDGLAQVLHDAATTRQVIVFTHDDRLTDAVRRMQLPATILGVTRRARSDVDVRVLMDPADQMLSDARAVTKDAERAGRKVLQRVVPGLCRTAVEFVLQSATRRTLLRKGGRNEEVESRLREATTLQEIAALAFFDDHQRGADVFGWLNQLGPDAVDLFKELKQATHSGEADQRLVARTEALVKSLRQKLS